MRRISSVKAPTAQTPPLVAAAAADWLIGEARGFAGSCCNLVGRKRGGGRGAVARLSVARRGNREDDVVAPDTRSRFPWRAAISMAVSMYGETIAVLCQIPSLSEACPVRHRSAYRPNRWRVQQGTGHLGLVYQSVLHAVHGTASGTSGVCPCEACSMQCPDPASP